METQIQLLQRDLRDVQRGISCVVKTLKFLQGFIESDYGMRYQFQAYKSTLPNHEQICKDLDSLEGRYKGLSLSDSAESSSLGHQLQFAGASFLEGCTNVVSGPSNSIHTYSQPQSDMHFHNNTSSFISTSQAPHHTNHSNLSCRSHQDAQLFRDGTSNAFPSTSHSDQQNPHLQLVDIKTNLDVHQNGSNDLDDVDTGNDYSANNVPEASETCDSEPSTEKPKKKKQRRKKGGGKDNWTREAAKIKRMRGEAYIGHMQIENNGGKRLFMQVKPMPSRKLGPPCNAAKCKKTSLRQCTSFPEHVRENLFKQFWHEMNWDQKKAFVSQYVQREFPKRSLNYERTGDESFKRTRTETLRYFLPLNGERLQVCQSMFKSTLSIGKTMLISWAKKLVQLPEEKPELYLPKRKYIKKSERLAMKQQETPKNGYKCPYCLETFFGRQEFHKHMANHMAHYDTCSD